MRRVSLEHCDSAWKIILEYYQAAAVVARDSKEDFGRYYFSDEGGVWLATVAEPVAEAVVGCVALRPLASVAHAAEVKRLYVQPQHRGRGIASALYQGLERYARDREYEWLYLDTTNGMLDAQRFYSAVGYELIARYNDNPQATIFMRKDLRAP